MPGVAKSGISVTCLWAASMGESPRKGEWPVKSSKITIPVV
jgi:hypothetical protein